MERGTFARYTNVRKAENSHMSKKNTRSTSGWTLWNLWNNQLKGCQAAKSNSDKHCIRASLVLKITGKQQEQRREHLLSEEIVFMKASKQLSKAPRQKHSN